MWSWRADGRVGGGLGQRLEGWCGKKQTKLAGVDTAETRRTGGVEGESRGGWHPDANSLKAATGMEGRKAGLLGVDWSRSAVKHGLASKLGWARGVSRGVNSRHLLVPQKGLGARPLPGPCPCPAPAPPLPGLALPCC